jgi:hypothetical protein
VDRREVVGRGGGRVSITGGEVEVRPLGVKLRSLTAALTAVPGRDSVAIQVSAVSGAAGGGMTLRGFMVYTDRDNPRLDLRVAGFFSRKTFGSRHGY